jgi:hypothetical protein
LVSNGEGSDLEIFGIGAIALGGSAYIWKDPRSVMKLFFISSLLWVVYFISISQMGAALSSAISAATFVVGAYASARVMRFFVPGGIGLTTGLILLTTSGLPAALIIVGNIVKGASPLFRERPYFFRILIIGGEVCWLTFGIINSAYSTIAWTSISIAMAAGSGAVHHTKARRKGDSLPGISSSKEEIVQ